MDPATYNPDNLKNFNTSGDFIASYVVNPATTSTTLSANPTQPPGSVYLQPVAFQATVKVTSLGGGTPVGMVEFTDSVSGSDIPGLFRRATGDGTEWHYGNVRDGIVGSQQQSQH